jgi:hypothetical protein
MKERNIHTHVLNARHHRCAICVEDTGNQILLAFDERVTSWSEDPDCFEQYLGQKREWIEGLLCHYRATGKRMRWTRGAP